MPKEQTQFKKGCKGGPGRPPGKRNVKTILRQLLDYKTTVKNPYEKGTCFSEEEMMCYSMIREAQKKGNVAAFREIFDRVYGKVQQQIDHTSDGEKMSLPQVVVLDAETKKGLDKLNDS